MELGNRELDRHNTAFYMDDNLCNRLMYDVLVWREIMFYNEYNSMYFYLWGLSSVNHRLLFNFKMLAVLKGVIQQYSPSHINIENKFPDEKWSCLCPAPNRHIFCICMYDVTTSKLGSDEWAGIECCLEITHYEFFMTSTSGLGNSLKVWSRWFVTRSSSSHYIFNYLHDL